MDDPLGDITVRLTVEDYLRVGVFVGQITTQKPNERRTELSPDDRLAFEIAGKLGRWCSRATSGGLSIGLCDRAATIGISSWQTGIRWTLSPYP